MRRVGSRRSFGRFGRERRCREKAMAEKASGGSGESACTEKNDRYAVTAFMWRSEDIIRNINEGYSI